MLSDLVAYMYIDILLSPDRKMIKFHSVFFGSVFRKGGLHFFQRNEERTSCKIDQERISDFQIFFDPRPPLVAIECLPHTLIPYVFPNAQFF